MGSAVQGYSKKSSLRVTISADMFVRSLLYRSFAQIRRIQFYALFSRTGGVKQTRSAEHLMSYEVSCLMHCGFRCHACSRYDRERTSRCAVPQKSTAPHVNRYLPPKADIDTDRFRDPGPDAQGNRLPLNNIIRTRPVGETLYQPQVISRNCRAGFQRCSHGVHEPPNATPSSNPTTS
jgi:hypothetical protein